MKRITLTFMILLSVFFTIWGVKMKHPINRPENVKEDTETPWYETKLQKQMTNGPSIRKYH